MGNERQGLGQSVDYPDSYFPQVSKARRPDPAKDERLRRRLIEELEELPTGVIKQALAEVRRAQGDNPLTHGGS